MKIIEWLKELWFQLTHSPNSPEGLRHRANKLIEKGFAENNPMVEYLRKRANIIEGIKNEH